MASSRKSLLARPLSIPLLRRIYKNRPHHPSLDFSFTGLIYCSMMVFLGLAAMNTQANLLFGVFGLMIGILVVSGFISRVMLRRLEIHRNLPRHAVVGEPLTLHYEITNRKRHWPTLSVNVTELDGMERVTHPPRCYLLHVAPKMTATVPAEVVPCRRGIFEFDHFQLSTSFPFGFIKRATVDRRKESVCVFPALAEVDREVIAMCRPADNMGEALRPRAGGVDEFYGLREYRPGDNPRHIYWRRSARTGVLVAKEMMRVSPPRLLLLLDTHLAQPTAENRSAVERTIANAASLASFALQEGLAVGLAAWNGKVVTLPPASGKQHREELLTLLACLPENLTYTPSELLHHNQWTLRSGATLVLLAPRPLPMPLPDSSRGAVVVLPASAQETQRWFRFRPGVRFDQEAGDAVGLTETGGG